MSKENLHKIISEDSNEDLAHKMDKQKESAMILNYLQKGGLRNTYRRNHTLKESGLAFFHGNDSIVKAMTLQWWVYVIIVFGIFFFCLILNYIVKKINETRLEERLCRVMRKNTFNVSQANNSQKLPNTKLNKNKDSELYAQQAISMIFSKEDNNRSHPRHNLKTKKSFRDKIVGNHTVEYVSDRFNKGIKLMPSDSTKDVTHGKHSKDIGSNIDSKILIEHSNKNSESLQGVKPTIATKIPHSMCSLIDIHSNVTETATSTGKVYCIVEERPGTMTNSSSREIFAANNFKEKTLPYNNDDIQSISGKSVKLNEDLLKHSIESRDKSSANSENSEHNLFNKFLGAIYKVNKLRSKSDINNEFKEKNSNKRELLNDSDITITKAEIPSVTIGETKCLHASESNDFKNNANNAPEMIASENKTTENNAFGNSMSEVNDSKVSETKTSEMNSTGINSPEKNASENRAIEIDVPVNDALGNSYSITNNLENNTPINEAIKTCSCENKAPDNKVAIINDSNFLLLENSNHEIRPNNCLCLNHQIDNDVDESIAWNAKAHLILAAIECTRTANSTDCVEDTDRPELFTSNVPSKMTHVVKRYILDEIVDNEEEKEPSTQSSTTYREMSGENLRLHSEFTLSKDDDIVRNETLIINYNVEEKSKAEMISLDSVTSKSHTKLDAEKSINDMNPALHENSCSRSNILRKPSNQFAGNSDS